MVAHVRKTPRFGFSRIFAALGAASLVVIGSAIPAGAVNATNYVALGDSYSAGVGSGDYGNSGGCKRSSHAAVQLWANDHAANFTFVACLGARTPDVLSQADSLKSDTSLVSVSVGGNDAGFTDVMVDCTFGSDQACVDRIDEAKAYVHNTLPGLLDGVYNKIKQRSPNAKVVVLGYPHFYKVPGDCSVGLSDTKRSAINSGADALDEVAASRAGAAGFTFADVRGTFAGHEICTSNRWLNSVVYPVDESYHPTASGQSGGYLPALTRGIG